MCIRDSLDPGKGGGEEAAFSLKGLQNEGGHLVGGGALLKDILEALEAGGKNFLLRQTVGTAAKVGELGQMCIRDRSPAGPARERDGRLLLHRCAQQPVVRPAGAGAVRAGAV